MCIFCAHSSTVGQLVLFHNLAIMTSTAENINVQVTICDVLTLNPLGKYPGVVYLDHMVDLFPYFENFHADFHVETNLYFQ